MADVNALKPAAATRWVAEATGSIRMRCRRCQRIGSVPRWGDGSPRQRAWRGCCIADVNASGAGRSEAMCHWGDGVGANASSQMSTRRDRQRWGDDSPRRKFGVDAPLRLL